MILVTGGTGHLGANLVRHLLGAGEELRLFVRRRDDPALSGLRVELVAGDLRDPSACRRAMAGVSRIYHCAAKLSTLYGPDPEMFEVNVLGTRNLLHAALEAGVEKVVVTGSLSATGHRDDRPTDETEPFNPLGPHLPYAFTKAAVEHECLKAVAEGLHVVVAVSSGIIGPWDFKPSRLGQALIRLARRRLPAYVPGGTEFVAARDIVAGHVLAMERGRAGQKYIFSTRFAEIEEVLRLFAHLAGVPMTPLRIPTPVMTALSGAAQPLLRWAAPGAPQLLTPAAIRLLAMRRRADISKAQRELGYAPTEIEAALADAYEWFVATGRIEPRRPAMAVPVFPALRP